MSKKTVAFKTTPKPSASAEEWVRSARPLDREAPAAGTGEPMKRFTIDVPLDLHTRVKVGCARRGLKDGRPAPRAPRAGVSQSLKGELRGGIAHW
jgi:hypothetical protein